ncbi:protein FAM169B [Nothobranchius furzeri]|uniref:Protein FAM169B-like n=3 Tax=Nothobranchius furzeri TaxID=105023 RepID=A0A9D2YT58_NOTFU|nr:protein FAM169B-like [Nothobranchius furzeri]
MYPVDLPPVEDTELTSASELYLTSLNATPCVDWFQSSQQLQVAITTASVSQLQLFEDDHPACAVLALHPPDDQTQVVALYLHEKWWRLDDVLRTSIGSRSGFIPVQSVVERVIVFLLSRVVERPPSPGEASFSLHPRTESCKLLWRDKQAVGFYTIKHKGSLCDSWSSCCYLLPVLDTLLVRRSCRRRGFGLQILEDFCSMFSSEEFLGVSSPLSPSMAAVVRRFLLQHQEHRERLYEVEAPGGWTQRQNIWLNIQLGRYSFHQEGEDLTSPVTCNTNAPQTERWDANQGEHSLIGTSCGTGCFSAARAEDLDLNPPRPTVMKGTVKSKSVLSEKHSEESSEEMQKSCKRAKRT